MDDNCSHDLRTEDDNVCMMCGLVLYDGPTFGMSYDDEKYYYGSNSATLQTYITTHGDSWQRLSRLNLHTQGKKVSTKGKAHKQLYESILEGRTSVVHKEDILQFLERLSVLREFGPFRGDDLHGVMLAYIGHRLRSKEERQTIKDTFFPTSKNKILLSGERFIQGLLKKKLIV